MSLIQPFFVGVRKSLEQFSSNSDVVTKTSKTIKQNQKSDDEDIDSRSCWSNGEVTTSRFLLTEDVKKNLPPIYC
jgi:hypothetical protein